jgi:hypothetical protein
VNRWAVISPCGKYRYTLGREEDDALFQRERGTVVFILNNPSTADAEVDDATVKKCWRYAQTWDYRAMVFVNTNPWRSTDPIFAREPSGESLALNDDFVRIAVNDAGLVVCAWGNRARQHLVLRMLKLLRGTPLYYLELAKDGAPKHPLYLPAHIEPRYWITL